MSSPACRRFYILWHTAFATPTRFIHSHHGVQISFQSYQTDRTFGSIVPTRVFETCVLLRDDSIPAHCTEKEIRSYNRCTSCRKLVHRPFARTFHSSREQNFPRVTSINDLDHSFGEIPNLSSRGAACGEAFRGDEGFSTSSFTEPRTPDEVCEQIEHLLSLIDSSTALHSEGTWLQLQLWFLIRGHTSIVYSHSADGPTIDDRLNLLDRCLDAILKIFNTCHQYKTQLRKLPPLEAERKLRSECGKFAVYYAKLSPPLITEDPAFYERIAALYEFLECRGWDKQSDSHIWGAIAAYVKTRNWDKLLCCVQQLMSKSVSRPNSSGSSTELIPMDPKSGDSPFDSPKKYPDSVTSPEVTEGLIKASETLLSPVGISRRVSITEEDFEDEISAQLLHQGGNDTSDERGHRWSTVKLVGLGVLALVRMGKVESGLQMVQAYHAQPSHGFLEPATYDILIKALISKMDIDRALEIYFTMRRLEPSGTPAPSTLGVLVSALSTFVTRSSSTVSESSDEESNAELEKHRVALDGLQTFLEDRGIDSEVDLPFLAGVVEGFCKCNNVEMALRFLERITDLVVTQKSLADQDDDPVTLTRNVKGERLLGHVYAVVTKSLIERDDDVVHATRLMAELEKRGVNRTLPLYTILMRTYLRRRQPKSVLNLYDDLRANPSSRPHLNQSIFNMVMKAHVLDRNLPAAEKLFEELVNSNFVPTLPTISTMMTAFARSEEVQQALDIYYRMIVEPGRIKPDRTLFNILIDAFARRGDLANALKWFDELILHNMRPDKFTYTILMSVLFRELRIEQAEEWYTRVFTGDVQPDVVTFSLKIYQTQMAWINSSGGMDDARGHMDLDEGLSAGFQEVVQPLLDQMLSLGIQPNAVTYTSILRTYLRFDDYRSVLNLFSQMIASGIRPDAQTYHAVIKAMARSGNVSGVIDLYDSLMEPYRMGWSRGSTIDNEGRVMQESPVEPDGALFAIVVDTAARFGRLATAFRVFEEMKARKYIPAPSVYFSLIRKFMSMPTSDGMVQASALYEEMMETLIQSREDRKRTQGKRKFFNVSHELLALLLTRFAELGWGEWCVCVMNDSLHHLGVLVDEETRTAVYGYLMNASSDSAEVSDGSDEGLAQPVAFLSAGFDGRQVAGRIPLGKMSPLPMRRPFSFQTLSYDFRIKESVARGSLWDDSETSNGSCDVHFAWIFALSVRAGASKDMNFLLQFFENLSQSGEFERMARLWMYLVGKMSPPVVPDANREVKDVDRSPAFQLKQLHSTEESHARPITPRSFWEEPSGTQSSDEPIECLYELVRGYIPPRLLDTILRKCGLSGSVQLARRLWRALVDREMEGFGLKESLGQPNLEDQISIEGHLWTYAQVLFWWESWDDLFLAATDDMRKLRMLENSLDMESGYGYKVLRDICDTLARRKNFGVIERILEYWDPLCPDVVVIVRNDLDQKTTSNLNIEE
ncbi:hypothetical protein BJ742DRAFT_853851 [Cladochytrium replicatum]|nr:hypothetical protein BJ742DRAFT_853851 [Cladochytrium replicatum]